MNNIPDRKFYYFFVMVVAAIMALHYTGSIRPVEVFFRSLTTPIIAAVHSGSMAIKDKYNAYAHSTQLADQVAACQKTIEDNTVDAARLRILENENAELKKQLGFRKSTTPPAQLAMVVGRNLDSADKTLVVDAGEPDGIKVGQPVVAGDGILVGKVVKVNEEISIVRLINDSQSKIAAAVLNTDQSLGIVEGGYGLSLRLKLVPRNEKLTVGDQVVTSGLEDNIPKGLLIGTIAVVENEAFQPFQQAVLTPATDLEKLTFVSVYLAK